MHEETLQEHLRKIAVRGIFFTLDVPQNRFTEWLVNRLFGGLLDNLLEVVVTFDEKVASESMNAGCDWIAKFCGAPAEFWGVERIPQEGPVLLVSNHPGYFDSMVIASKLPRQDLKVLAGGVHYFKEMPHLSQYLMYTDEEVSNKVSVLRQSVRHLEKGGCVLIFPTGQSDPDPDAMPGARERIQDWSESVALILRRLPVTRMVPIAISGILNPRFLKHPFSRIQRQWRYRQRVAEFFQLAAQFRKPGTPPLAKPRVTFGFPVSGRELAANGDREALMPNIRSAAEIVLAEHMTQ